MQAAWPRKATIIEVKTKCRFDEIQVNEGECGPLAETGKGDAPSNGAEGDEGNEGDEGDEGDEGNEGNEGDKGKGGDEGDEGNEGNEGDEGNEGNEGNEGDEGNEGFSIMVGWFQTAIVTSTDPGHVALCGNHAAWSS